jgi:hypothetical protein
MYNIIFNFEIILTFAVAEWQNQCREIDEMKLIV